MAFCFICNAVHCTMLSYWFSAKAAPMYFQYNTTEILLCLLVMPHYEVVVNKNDAQCFMEFRLLKAPNEIRGVKSLSSS